MRRVRRLAGRPGTAEPLLLGLAAAVGLATGLLAVLLIAAIRAVQHTAWVSIGGGWPTTVAVLVFPTVGGLLVGLLITSWMPRAQGGGVAEVMADVALHSGRMPGALAPAKLAASAINLGTGASGGREGPIVQIGGAVGSLFGRVFALDEGQKRALIAAGAGAGIAASFNAPIGGMLFALEVILGGFAARYLQVVVVACVVASVTARELVGPNLVYNPPPHRLGDPRELLLYALLGLAAAAVSVLFIRVESGVASRASRLRLPKPVVLGLGGLGVGLVALIVPAVLGTGDDLPPLTGVHHNPIADLLNGGLGGGLDGGLGAGLIGMDANTVTWTVVGVLLLLAIAKLLATSLTVGTGNSGGSFSPAIFMGAALGSSFGHAAAILVPGSEASAGAFALVGMAGVLGGTVRAPLTAILLAFELTGDYGLVLPLMLTTGIATMVAERMHHDSIYTLPLRKRGIVYGEPEDVDIMQTVQISEVMVSPAEFVTVDLPVSALAQRFRRQQQNGFPVVDGDRLVGIVTVSDLARAADSTADLAPGGAADRLTVGDVCTRPAITVTASDPVFRAVRRMADLNVGRLPVVAEDDHGKLVGLVRRTDVVKAYQHAVARALSTQQRKAASRVRNLGGTQFIELVIQPSSVVDGQLIRDVAWPTRTLVTAVRRRGELILPTGQTLMQAHDELVVLSHTDSVEALRALVSEQGVNTTPAP